MTDTTKSAKSGFAKPPTPAERAARLETPSALAFIQGQEAAVTPERAAPTPEIITPAANKPALPWHGKSTQHLKQKPFRMLEDEAAMLDYVAGTTFGETAQSIQLQGIRYITVKLLREKGFNVTQDEATGKIHVLDTP